MSEGGIYKICKKDHVNPESEVHGTKDEPQSGKVVGAEETAPTR